MLDLMAALEASLARTGAKQADDGDGSAKATKKAAPRKAAPRKAVKKASVKKKAAKKAPAKRTRKSAYRPPTTPPEPDGRLRRRAPEPRRSDLERGRDDPGDDRRRGGRCSTSSSTRACSAATRWCWSTTRRPTARRSCSTTSPPPIRGSWSSTTSATAGCGGAVRSGLGASTGDLVLYTTPTFPSTCARPAGSCRHRAHVPGRRAERVPPRPSQ